MDQNIDYQSTRPVPKANQIRPIPITHSPKKLILASLVITIPRKNANNNQVELNAQVGVQGGRNTSSVLFKIFRDGEEVHRSQERVQARQNHTVTLQAVDTNVSEGPHTYMVTAENTSDGGESFVVGPISFNALASGNPDEESNRNQDRKRDRNRDSDRNRNRNKNRKTSSERDRERGRGTNQDRSQDKGRDKDRDRHQNAVLYMEGNPSLRTSHEMDQEKGRDTNQDQNQDRDRSRSRDRDRSRNRDRRSDFFRDPLRGIDKEIDRFIRALDFL